MSSETYTSLLKFLVTFSLHQSSGQRKQNKPDYGINHLQKESAFPVYCMLGSNAYRVIDIARLLIQHTTSFLLSHHRENDASENDKNDVAELKPKERPKLVSAAAHPCFTVLNAHRGVQTSRWDGSPKDQKKLTPEES